MRVRAGELFIGKMLKWSGRDSSIRTLCGSVLQAANAFQCLWVRGHNNWRNGYTDSVLPSLPDLEVVVLACVAIYMSVSGIYICL